MDNQNKIIDEVVISRGNDINHTPYQTMRKYSLFFDKRVFLIYLLITSFSSLLSVIGGLNDLSTIVIDIPIAVFFVMPDIEPLALSYLATGLIILLNITSFVGALFLYIGKNRLLDGLTRVGIQLSKIFFTTLIILAIMGIVSLFFGLAGPLFLMPFALIPMIIFGLIFAAIHYSLSYALDFFIRFDVAMRGQTKLIILSKFKKSLLLSASLLLLSGVFMIVFFIVANKILDEETMEYIFDGIFKAYPFSISSYIYSFITIIYIVFINKKDLSKMNS